MSTEFIRLKVQLPFYAFVKLYLFIILKLRYRDGAGNTVEENSSVFSLIWMH